MKGPAKTVLPLICAVVLIAIVPANVGAAEISIPTATKKITPPELGPVQPFNAKTGGLPSPQQTDLAVTSFGLTADARVTYIVVNRGRTVANSPFVVDLFIDGKREDTVKHNALPPITNSPFATSNGPASVTTTGTIQQCGSKRRVRPVRSGTLNGLKEM